MTSLLIYIVGTGPHLAAYDSLESLLSWVGESHMLSRSENGALCLFGKNGTGNQGESMPVWRVILNSDLAKQASK